MEWLYKQLIENKQKAIVGFALAALTTAFTKHGIDITSITVADGFQMLGYGLLTYLGVYVKRNQA